MLGTSMVLFLMLRVVLTFSSFSRIWSLLASASLSVSRVSVPGTRMWRSTDGLPSLCVYLDVFVFVVPLICGGMKLLVS